MALSMRIVHQEYEHWERIARPTMTTTTSHQAFCSFMATYLAIIAANDHLRNCFFLFIFLAKFRSVATRKIHCEVYQGFFGKNMQCSPYFEGKKVRSSHI
jgi:hypothetical protein